MPKKSHATYETAIPSLAIILATYRNKQDTNAVSQECDELCALALTLGYTVSGQHCFPLARPHPTTFFFTGTLEAIGQIIADANASMVIINDTLSPRQHRFLTDCWNTVVYDRSDIILRIFSTRAKTAEGRLQVKLAQLTHDRSRIRGGWTHLERQRGGIGMMGGPGEQQKEIDQRLIDKKVKKLNRQLYILGEQRATRRQARHNVPLTSCALVGYTNAGKSTLFNALTKAHVIADDLLFATLDPTSRVITLNGLEKIVVTDTVGFIQKLPAELIEAFSSTLEEVHAADFLVIIVDASHPNSIQQCQTVFESLDTMHCNQPRILVMNKSDKIADDEKSTYAKELFDLTGMNPLVISAVRREGFDLLYHHMVMAASRLSRDYAENRPSNT